MAVSLALLTVFALNPRAAGGQATDRADTSVVGSAEPQPQDIRAGSLLDSPVDRSEYRLGPGDVLSLSLFGELSRSYQLAVTPEGAMVVPGVGVVPVLGLTIEQAQERLRGRILRYYQNITIALTLARVRMFKIFVVGDVADPGAKVASAVTRVSEVLPAPPQGDMPRLAPRNIVLRRSTGDSLVVDLARFRQTGDLGANPRVREGDVLVVQKVDQTVAVYGRVFFPGMYEYRSGEALADLLEIANGATRFPANAADSVRVSRAITPFRREVVSFAVADAIGAPGQAFKLEPFDAVYVPEVSNFKEYSSAIVEGEVAFPGTYPIVPGITTIRDLVQVAGGLTEQASLVDATLTRERRVVDASSTDLQRIPVEFLSETERRLLQVQSQGDERNVVVDFIALFGGSGNLHNLPLRPGDLLMIPRRRNEVSVVGAVRSPGIVEYIPGRRTDHFIQLAGGFSRRADRDEVAVFRAKLGTRVDVRDIDNIEPGDRIVVPYEERRTIMQTLTATNTILGTISGLTITVLTIMQVF